MSEFANRAMLAKVVIHGYGGEKTDREVTKEVAAMKGAGRNCGRFRKKLISSPYLDKFNKAATELRDLHNSLTAPWLDGGHRLLPALLFWDWRDQISEKKREVLDFAHEFIAKDYLPAIERARVNADGLGQMFNEKDYLSQAALEGKFGIDISFSPIPVAADWRVKLTDDIEQEIQADLTDRLKAAEELAMKDIWNRVYEAVSKMEDRLKNGKRLYESSFTSFEDLIDILPKLNISNDPTLNKLAAELKLKLCIDRDDVKEDVSLRDQKADEAKAIMVKMSAYM